MSKDLQIVENLEQRVLFQEYVKLGDSRSLPRLQSEGITNRSMNTLLRWSKRFNWVERANQADKALADFGGATESQKENLERKQLILDIVDYMVRDVATFDKDGNLVGTKFKARNVAELRTLIEIRDEQLGLKQKGKTPNGDINVDKAVFIIKK